MTASFTVKATYKTQSGTQAYQLITAAINLTSASIPSAYAYAYTPYAAYDFKPLLSVQNEASFAPNLATFTATGLPAGLTLSSNGVLSGTPSVAVATSQALNFTVSATYQGLSTSQTYSLTLNPEADPYWNNVSYLFNFEGANGATSLSEPVKGAAATFYGSAKLVTSTYKLGQSSLSTVSGYVTLPGDIGFFGTGDFTVETFFKANALGGNNMQLMECRPANTNGPYVSLAVRSDGSVSWYTNSVEVISTSAGQLKDTSWYHLAYSRQNGVAKLFINGKLIDTKPDTNSYAKSGNGCWLGRNAYGTQQGGFYVDAMRITRGASRYSSEFTPPTRPYPTYGG